MAMTRKELKQLIKEHKVKQVLSMPELDMLKGVSRGASVIYKYVDEEIYIQVLWYWTLDDSDNIVPKQMIEPSSAEYLAAMEEEVKAMHADLVAVESVHHLYNECTDIMNGYNSELSTMEDKLCAKYIRKACDFFIHDRRYHQ